MMKRFIVITAFLATAALAILWPSGEATRAQATCFTQTGFCINNQAFLQYFIARGGVETFGFPISREFTFLGFRVQFFQGHIMQLQPNGSVATMNLLDPGLMPVTRVNGSAFPAADPQLVAQTPSVSDPNYATRIIDFIRQNAPEEFNGQPVHYFSTFISTVNLATAFPGGGGNPELVPLLNLEIWGSVTSRPMPDPSNGGFIYQRFQRSIMHYRDVCRCTERILLADWFKTVIVGTAPADLAGEMAGSPFINQWNPSGERWLNRPGDLPTTDLTNAFVPDLPGFATPPAAGPAAGGGGAQPTATPQPSTAEPTIGLDVSNARPGQGENFTIRLTAGDADGIDIMFWWATDTDDQSLQDTHTQQCNGATPCSQSWTVNTTDTGRIILHAQSRDTKGNLSGEVTQEIRVAETTATPTATGTVQPTPTGTPEPTATATITLTPTMTMTSTP